MIKRVFALLIIFIIGLQAQTTDLQRVSFEYPNARSSYGYYENYTTIAAGSTDVSVILEKAASKDHYGYCDLSCKITGDSTVTVKFGNWNGSTIGASTTLTSLTGTVTATSTATIKTWDIGTNAAYRRNALGYEINWSVPSATDTAQVIYYRVDIR